MEEKELAAGNVMEHPEGSLRWNAQLLLMRGDTPSIQQIADRLDGKPAQEQTVNVNSAARSNQSEDELRDYITTALLAHANTAAAAKAEKPDDKKLN
jgi:hypothetical protein